jgi:hypothetical protein
VPLNRRTRPHGYRVRTINDGLGLPHDHLSALADKKDPEPPPAPRPPAPVAPASTKTPVAALLSLTDLGPGAQMVADYKAYVAMVARELAEGMTQEQRSDTGRFLLDLSSAVWFGKP